MPASLRWLLLLIGLSVATAFVAGAGMYAQNRARARTLAEATVGGSATAGAQAIAGYGCGACHTVSGVPGARGKVGPALDGVATRAHLAGRLPNDPDTMIRWLEHPQALVPGTGMPEQGVTRRDAQDMAAYLYTLRN